MDLNERQKMFCEEYLIDFNATQAATRAGYSPKTANEQGARLLANVSIQSYLSELMAARAKRVQISQDAVLKELEHIAFDDIKNYLDFRTERQVVGNEDGKNIYDYKTIVDLKDSGAIDTRSVQEVSLDSKGTLKFKLYSKDDALLQLGRHLGMFHDKVEVTDGSLESRKAYEKAAEAIKKKRG